MQPFSSVMKAGIIKIWLQSMISNHECASNPRDRRQKTSGFLSRLCLLRGGGGQDKSAKIVNFQTKVCCFKLQSLHHRHYKTTIWIHICCLSACWIFYLCRLSCWGACALAYKAQRPKMRKLAYWKPALSIRKQNSSHLQDIVNAFSTKDRVK